MTIDEPSREAALRLTQSQRATLERLVSELSGDPQTQQNILDALTRVAGIESLLAHGDHSTLSLADLMRFLHTEANAALASAASGRAMAEARVNAAEGDAMATARADSRRQVQMLIRDLHRFDAYLTFAGPEDELAYRDREAERRAYIEEQHARGTPEGDLNASGAAIGQMVDAQGHGAADSPEFRQRLDELGGTTARLRQQVALGGGSTARFDNRVREELRATLRRRGVPDAEIDARLAAHPDDPLSAVRDHLRSEEDLRAVDRSISQIGRRESIAPAPPPVIIAVADQQAGSASMDDVMAEFRACGIASADHQPGEDFAHGVATCERPGPSPGRH
ncbi:MAG: hypothetical protein QOD42_3729 [Sphingomonadales bacterium]|jgi:hypothetical protein|nr:hypothetical protein [Sphingomonadales bacterium]